MKHLLISIFSLVVFNIHGQVICFSNDSAGNRIKRQSSCIFSITVEDQEKINRNLTGLELRNANSNKDLSELIVYPNPTSGVFRLNNQEQFLGGELIVMSLEGKMIVSLILTNGDIDLMHLPSGHYFLVLTKNSARRTAKLFITN